MAETPKMCPTLMNPGMMILAGLAVRQTSRKDVISKLQPKGKAADGGNGGRVALNEQKAGFNGLRTDAIPHHSSLAGGLGMFEVHLLPLD